MDIQTALIALASGVVVPVITAILANPKTPSRIKRLLPLVLSAVGALIVTAFNIESGTATVPGTLSEWVISAAMIVGTSQAIYAAMPATWKKLETATSTEKDSQLPKE